MTHILVLYHPTDRAAAQAVHRTLQAEGLPAVGVTAASLANAATIPKDGAVVVALFSPAATQDATFRQAWSRIRQHKLPVQRVLVKPLNPAQPPLRGPLIDATTDTPAAMQQLVAQLRKLAAPSTPPPGRLPRKWLIAAATLIVLLMAGAGTWFSTATFTRPDPTKAIVDVPTSVKENTSNDTVVQQPTVPRPPTANPRPGSSAASSDDPTTSGTVPGQPDDDEATDDPDADDGDDDTSEPVYADFLINTYDGPAPLTVVVAENLSDGDIAAYAWDFEGDGLIDSEAEIPAPIVYNDPGEYELTLTVYGEAGDTDTYSEFIEVYADDGSPAAAFGETIDVFFSYDPLFGEAPLVVTFLNETEGPASRYTWDFNGDGTTDSTAANPPPYTYNTPGEYTVTLTAFDENERRYAMSDVIVVDGGEAPLALFETDIDFGVPPMEVTFTNFSEGEITSYAWDFDGNGTTDSTAANPPPYTYTQPGDYLASLTVSGPGGTDTYDTFITLEPSEEPFAFFDVDFYDGFAPLTVTIQNFSEGEITSYAWDFDGDGTTDSTEANPPPYTYNDPGEYDLTLTVSGPGGTNTDMLTIYVEAREAPSAFIDASPDFGTAPLTVTFSDFSDGNITSRAWDFNGDGTPDSTAANPEPYTYNQPGNYTASLTVTGPGGTDTDSITIVVDAVPVPIADFIADKEAGKPPLTVTFSNTSDGNITGYAWDFNGDDTPDSTAANPPPYTYNQPGNYRVTLTVTGPGGTDTANTTIEVEPLEAPTADFSVDTFEGTAPLTVTFSNRSTGDILRYAWDFDGDGNPDSTAADPESYIYTQAGEYEATLTVTGLDGTTDTYTEFISVTAPLLAGMIATPVDGPAPLTVSFTDQSSGPVSAYAWDFDGDGTPDAEYEAAPGPVSHTYTTPGTYRAALTVFDDMGTASTPFTIEITVRQATVEPTPTPLTPTPETPTATPSPSATVSPQPPTTTATPTATVTLSPQPPTTTATPTATVTLSPQPPTATATPTATVTLSPQPPTATATPTATVTLSPQPPTGTATPTATVTLSPQPPTGTATPTEAVTLTPEPSENSELNAAFEALPTTGAAPLNVLFTDQSTGPIAQYEWDFNGDSQPDTPAGEPIIYTYDTPGTYTASLVVIDADGNRSTPFTITITVSEGSLNTDVIGTLEVAPVNSENILGSIESETGGIDSP